MTWKDTAFCGLALVLASGPLIAQSPAGSPVSAQGQAADADFSLILMTAAPLPAMTLEVAQKVQADHRDYLDQRFKAGELLAYAPVLDGSDLREVLLYRPAEAGQRARWIADDPSVRAGVLNGTACAWRLPGSTGTAYRDAISDFRARSPLPGSFVFVLLRTEGKLDNRERELHRKHMVALRTFGRLAAWSALAGSKGWDEAAVVATANRDEALTWLREDPVIASGKIGIEAHAWGAPELLFAPPRSSRTRLERLEPLQPGRPAWSSGWSPFRDAEKDLAEARMMAQKEGRLVLVYLGGAWSEECATLDEAIRSDPELLAWIQSHTVLLRIHCGRENPNGRVRRAATLTAKDPPGLSLVPASGHARGGLDGEDFRSGQGFDTARMLEALKVLSAPLEPEEITAPAP